MKLQNKINYRFLILLLIVFFAAGAILYFALGLVINENLDDILEEKSDKIKNELQKGTSITELVNSKDQTFTFEPSKLKKFRRVYSDTTIYNSEEREHINYRKMTFLATANSSNYMVSILTSKLEMEDLLALTFYFLLCLFTLIVALLYFINRWLSASVWHPFYKTLDQLTTFKIGQKEAITFDQSTIYEFDQLNNSLTKMVQKAQSDFSNMKAFTENASHEIQTPIAIIKSKLETVLHDKTLPNQRYEQIESAYKSVSRLSKLNEALLLLSKIENQQFPDSTEIDLCELIKQRIEFIEELIDFKKIEVEYNISSTFAIKINPYLAEILVNNLLGNAVKHNIINGQIIITSKKNIFTISNTGNQLNIAPEMLFQRFAKHNTGNESTGLGLAIAAEICSKSNLRLSYNYQNKYHIIEVYLEE